MANSVMRVFAPLVLTMAVALMAGGSAHATAYTISTLDYPTPAGGNYGDTFLYGINDSGTIIGNADYLDSSFNFQQLGVTGPSSGFTPVSIPGLTDNTNYANISFYGINNAGTIVGTYEDVSKGYQSFGFSYSGGMLSTIAVGGAQQTVVTGINNKGEIVGYYYNGITDNGFTDLAGTISPLSDNSGAYNTELFGINDNGDIVGTATSSSSGDQIGLYWNGSSFSNVSVAGAQDVEAYGINNSNQIVGSYDTGGCTTYGFVSTSGAVTTLVAPTVTGIDCAGTFALGINNHGTIVGYSSVDEDPDGFIATQPSVTPIPEPASAAVFGVALLGLLRRRRR